MNIEIKKKLKGIQLNENSTIETGIKSLIKSGQQIIIVVNKKKEVIGTVTDGDIRNFLINKKNFLNYSLKNIMNKRPVILKIKKDINLNFIKNFMLRKNVQQLPVINKKNKLINIFTAKDFLKSEIKNNTFFILAGGYGTRLMPYTKNIPKPLIKVDNKPIIVHLIEKAKSQGFRNFVISTGYLKNKIIGYLGNGKKLDINIRYIKESKPLGTAGSLVFLEKQREPFIVCNGDIMSTINFKELLSHHNQNKAFATVACKEYTMQNPFGVLMKSGKSKVNLISEKPNYRSLINIGAYVFNPDVIKFLKKPKFISMVEFINKLIKKKRKVLSFETEELWFDIGTPKDLKKFNKSIRA